jgi:AcrR family transcriptional regulator
MRHLQGYVNRFISITMKQADMPRKTGRPLSFDRESALQKAMLEFWRYGYEGTSLNDLTRAMGVKPPSIYAAFGDKEHLFLEAVQHYLSGDVTSQSIIETADSARDAAMGLLKTAAIGFTGENTPRGCLLASSTTACSAASAHVQAKLAAIRHGIEAMLAGRIRHGIKSGEVEKSSDADALAAHIMAVIQGMSTLARDGAARAKLLKIAEMAMKAWPET